MGNVHGKIRKNKEFAVGNGSAMGNDSVLRVQNETVTLLWVEVGTVVGITQQKNRNEAESRIRNEKGIIKSERTRRSSEFNGPHANCIDGLITKPFYKVWCDRLE
jgi:hypothetical protein